MAESLTLVMYWALRSTLCNALRSDAKPLPYQAVMQLVKIDSIFIFIIFIFLPLFN
jgi:hypothetical protein